jgi:hypothetical protein
VAGANVLKPRLQLLADDQLSGADRDAVQLRLEHFLRRRIAAVLEPLVKLAEAEDITGLARGLAFRLVENLGVVAREQVADDVKTLSQEDRAGLRKYGVRFGAFHIFIPALLKPGATQLRLLLWALGLERDGVLEPPCHSGHSRPGTDFGAVRRTTPKGFYRIIGFRICGARAVRIDMLERLSDLIRARVFWKPAFPDQPRPARLGGRRGVHGHSRHDVAGGLFGGGILKRPARPWLPVRGRAAVPMQQASLQQESAEPDTPPAGTETGASLPQSLSPSRLSPSRLSPSRWPHRQPQSARCRGALWSRAASGTGSGIASGPTEPLPRPMRLPDAAPG